MASGFSRMGSSALRGPIRLKADATYDLKGERHVWVMASSGAYLMNSISRYVASGQVSCGIMSSS